MAFNNLNWSTGKLFNIKFRPSLCLPVVLLKPGQSSEVSAAAGLYYSAEDYELQYSVAVLQC